MSNGRYAPPGPTRSNGPYVTASEPSRGGVVAPRSWWEKTGPFDLVISCVLVALAAFAYLVLSGGSGLRVALAVPVLFFIPGYLLIEAVSVTATAGRRRAIHAWIAIGVSPALVALLALATVVLPGGFQGGAIVSVVTVTCFALAGCAYWRRQRESVRALRPRSNTARPSA